MTQRWDEVDLLSEIHSWWLRRRRAKRAQAIHDEGLATFFERLGRETALEREARERHARRELLMSLFSRGSIDISELSSKLHDSLSEISDIRDDPFPRVVIT